MTEDQILTCRDCLRDFPFSVGEQKFFAEKGLMPPKRCLECRQAARLARDYADKLAAGVWSGEPEP
jgi:hypothetical protein